MKSILKRIFGKKQRDCISDLKFLSEAKNDCRIFYDTHFKEKVVVIGYSKLSNSDEIYIKMKGINSNMETSCDNFSFDKRFKPILRA